jgi:hypothetical protein
MLQTHKLNNEKWKKSSFYKEKSLVGKWLLVHRTGDEELGKQTFFCVLDEFVKTNFYSKMDFYVVIYLFNIEFTIAFIELVPIRKNIVF